MKLGIDRRELAGAVADLGVLVPIATALIVVNGLSATAVLLPAGLLYLAAAYVYRLPVPVQPLKAFGAIAIASGLGSDEIAAGALLMGVIFLALGRSGLIDLAAKAFPRALIRGVQITVGLLFLKVAWGLVADAPKSFDDSGADPALLLALAAGRARRGARVPAAARVARAGGDRARDGPRPGRRRHRARAVADRASPRLDAATFATAFTVLVLPQLPLTFANSCIATSDAARTYFGERAERVKPGRLATTLGVANLLSGAALRDARLPRRRRHDRPPRVRRARRRSARGDRRRARAARGRLRHEPRRAARRVPATGARGDACRRRRAAPRPRARPRRARASGGSRCSWPPSASKLNLAAGLGSGSRCGGCRVGALRVRRGGAGASAAAG